MLGPLVSIITVVYNGGKTIEKTIRSVLCQTYTHIEYIIIDGGSTDGTLEIIKKYECNISIIISEPDNGLYDAMNKGIRLANGELIGMINSDDWYEKDAVSIVVDSFLNYPFKDIFHANRFNILADDSRALIKFNPSIFKFKFIGMTYHHPSMFVTNREYRKHLYNTKLSVLSDYQFVLEAYYTDSDKFQYIDSAYVNYRIDGISSQIKLKNRLREGFIARKNSGMNLFLNLFSCLVRFFVIITSKFRAKLKNDFK